MNLSFKVLQMSKDMMKWFLICAALPAMQVVMKAQCVWWSTTLATSLVVLKMCEKRKPKYTSSCTQIDAFIKSLRQTQTPTVVAAPQLLTSLQCQIKELVPPRLLSARQTPSFLSRRHTQRNRSTRTRAGTRPQPTNKERKQDVPVWLLFQVP